MPRSGDRRGGAPWLEVGRRSGELVLQPAGAAFFDEHLAVAALRGAHHERPVTPAVTTPTDAPPCRTCGTLMQRAGRCHRCPNCGETDGCG